MKLVNIIDPGMIDHIGHHRELNYAIGQELVARGFEVIIHANKLYNSPIQNGCAQLKVIPYFSGHPYQIFQKNISLSESVLRHRYYENVFAAELSKLNLRGIIHYSNLFSYHLKGIASLSTQGTATACIHHHPARYSETGEFLWIHAAQTAGTKLNEIQLLAVEPGLADEVDRLTSHGTGVQVVPFPLQPAPPAEKTHSTHRIGILGSLRTEQGMGHLQQTIDVIKSSGHEILLQDTKDKLTHFNHLPGVVKLGFLECFSDAFQLCDAVLLNYEPDAYRFMGSGVLWESAANGVPILYARGGAMASFARRFDVGIPFFYANPHSLKKALAHYSDNRAAVHGRAREAAVKIRAANTVACHVDHLL